MMHPKPGWSNCYTQPGYSPISDHAGIFVEGKFYAIDTHRRQNGLGIEKVWRVVTRNVCFSSSFVSHLSMHTWLIATLKQSTVHSSFSMKFWCRMPGKKGTCLVLYMYFHATRFPSICSKRRFLPNLYHEGFGG